MTSAAAGARVIEARNIRKAYPGTVALDGVDFTVERGRVHALIGENGAGKSTLVNILSGVDQPTSGDLRVAGLPVRLRSVRDAARLGIGVIHQELQLFPDLSVLDNLFVGRERRDRWGLVDRRSELAEAHAALEKLGQTLDPATRLGSLPLGQQQMVEIARALVHDVRTLMMDEPTSALSAGEIHALFRVIRDLASHGVAVVYISHRLEELLDVADTVTVLRDGRVVGESAAAAVDVPWIVARMTGRPPRPASSASGGPPHPSQGPSSAALTVDHLSLSPRAGRGRLDDVSIAVDPGEVVGIYGLMGAGRTELFESILGVHADAAGHVSVGGRSIDGLGITERVQAGLFLVPEDRKAAGLVPALSVAANVTLSSLDRVARRGYLSPGAEQRAAEPIVADLRVKAPHLDAPVTSLSGGNQQKVLIARALMSRPRVLLMDEPTRGVDVAAKAEILEAMRRVAATGVAVVFATSDLGEVLAASTRTLVMAHGRIAADFPGGAATEATIAAAASASVADRPPGPRRPTAGA